MNAQSYRDHCLIVVGCGGEADEQLCKRRIAAGGAYGAGGTSHGHFRKAALRCSGPERNGSSPHLFTLLGGLTLPDLPAISSDASEGSCDLWCVVGGTSGSLEGSGRVLADTGSQALLGLFMH